MTDKQTAALMQASVPDAQDVCATVDATGMLCPRPIIELGKALRQTEPGDTIYVIATDEGFFPDLLRWIRSRSAEVAALRQEDDRYLAWIVAGP